MNAAADFGFDDVDPAHLRAAGSGKWNKYPADVLSAWVADMDFPVPPCVTDVLRRHVETRVHGYPPAGFVDVLIEEFCRYTNERTAIGVVVPELVRACDDAVQAMHAALRACTDRGDRVAILTPLYPPFVTSIEANHRVVVEHRMAPGDDGVWRFDAERLDAQLRASGARALMLCSPHNPVGRLWSRDELETVGRLVIANDLTVIADEIHSDLVFDGAAFVGFASISDELRARTITITSANKAYNLAGLKVAMLAFGSDDLRARFESKMTSRTLGQLSTPGVLANLAVYRDGGPWLDAVLAYLAQNRLVFTARLVERAPAVVATVPEATYLTWLDFSAVPGVAGGLSVGLRLVDEARVGLNEGPTFGGGLECFARANLATSRTLVLELADRIGRWAGAQQDR